MDLEKITIEKLEDERGAMEKAAEEVYKYGVYRGGASASGDKYAMLGGPDFDAVLKDYLVKKFGISNSLIEISGLLQKIPKTLVDKLRKGFDKGYLEQAARNREEDDDDDF